MSGDRPRALRIGLTGPIGCGKSTIAGWLAARGAVVIDADVLARAILEPGEPAYVKVVEAFGPAFVLPDGCLDRAALARLVFAEPAERARLEAITGPAVRPRIMAALSEADAAAAEVVVLEAIRLVEGGYVDEVDEVWLVTCDPASQRLRLAARGMSSADAERRMAAQAELVSRVLPVATRVIETSGPVADSEAAVDTALAAAVTARRAG